MKLHMHSFTLPHRHTFRIARESKNEQRTFIVELEQDGISGYGESAEDPYYNASVEQMQAALEPLRNIIESASPDQPEQLWSHIHQQLEDAPFALNALDIAAHDLFGKRQGKQLYEIWGLDPKNNALTDYTIGIDNNPKMVEKMDEFPNWPVYKIKLGTDEDVEIIKELRKHTDSVFRVDANCGWTPEECVTNANAFMDLNVEFIEQPLKADNWEGMAYVKQHSPLPIIADESCINESDVARCDGVFDGINIKLCKCGGLTPARRMIADAKQRGLKLMVGCMTESTVGISAIAQLLPELDYVDMDGALLLAADTATGIRIDQGKCIYSDTPGTGAKLIEANELS